MKKLCFISYIASPHQVRLEPYLQKYYDTYFFFYDYLGGRQSWWKVDLGERCKILPCKFKWRAKYLTLSPLKYLRQIKPDIVMLGGFSVPANIICYLWARWHGCKTVVQTERSRDKKGNPRGYTLMWRVLRYIYRNVDMVMCTADDIVPQFRDTLRFGNKVVGAHYPSDLDKYFKHQPRGKKDAYTLIYANRMTDIYDPLMAIDIFAEVLKRRPKTKLKMNASGELRPHVEAAIAKYGIGASVEFLDNIKHWDDLDPIYQSCDIMYLPAKFSNGNYTIAEAMCSGMAIVISDKVLGESAASLKSGDCGFILPHAIEPFVEKICWIIEHPEYYKTITDRNRELMRPRTEEATAALYADLFCKLDA